MWPLDGVQGLLFGTFLEEDTEYGPGYSHSAFKQISPGMQRGEVELLIGPPLNEWPMESAGQHLGARWSHSPSDTHFRLRVVWFRSGIVVGVHTEFYVD